MGILVKFLLLLSQAVNAFVFGGDADESLSARAWREYRNRTPGWELTHAKIDTMLGDGHCQRCYLARQAREAGRK